MRSLCPGNWATNHSKQMVHTTSPFFALVCSPVGQSPGRKIVLRAVLWRYVHHHDS